MMTKMEAKILLTQAEILNALSLIVEVRAFSNHLQNSSEQLIKFVEKEMDINEP